MPKEVATMLYKNFFNTINIVEKELLEVLYQSNLKGEEVSTKTINTRSIEDDDDFDY